jgi:hypothetical protein
MCVLSEGYSDIELNIGRRDMFGRQHSFTLCMARLLESNILDKHCFISCPSLESAAT